MREHNNFKYTCLFGGGAIRGAAHVGVIRALSNLGIEPTTLAGSSVGSMVAALYAVGYSSEEISDVFLSVNFELFRDISLGFNSKFALSKGEVFLDWIRELIERKFYGDSFVKGQSEHVKFKDLGRDLIIVTTNMKDFSCREFSNFETPDFEVAMAVRISCCMPGLMKALTYDGDMLLDGDLLKGKPMWALSKNIQNVTDRILEIRLEGSFTGSDSNPLDYINGMYSCITSTETSFIKSLYGSRDRYDYLTIDTGDVVVVDFNFPSDKRQAIIDNGYKQTMAYFTDYLIVKKQKILDIYSNILDKFRQIQGFMLIKKYLAAKNTLSELFIYLAKHRDIIDSELYDAVCMFQQLLFANVKSGLLGRANCTNKETILNSLNSLISDLSVRVDEIEKYISKFSI
jgi:NTE family protein